MNKQINNFAKVIPLDSNGNPIADPLKKEEYVIKDIKKDNNPMAKVYIAIILLLLALIIGFIMLYVMPRMK